MFKKKNYDLRNRRIPKLKNKNKMNHCTYLSHSMYITYTTIYNYTYCHNCLSQTSKKHIRGDTLETSRGDSMN